MSPVRLKRVSAGHYTAHGFTVIREGSVWALYWPNGSCDGCESLQHARECIAFELWMNRRRSCAGN